VKLPFISDTYDYMHSAKRSPVKIDELAEHLECNKEPRHLLDSFVTKDTPGTPARPPDGQVRFRYFGHACVLVESARSTVLCDPVISYDYPSDVPRLTYSDLPSTIDYLLITHNHQDHFSPETLLQLRHMTRTVIVPKNGTGALADVSLKLALQHMGFRNVIEVDDLESVMVEGGCITALPFLGEHADLNIRCKSAWLV